MPRNIIGPQSTKSSFSEYRMMMEEHIGALDSDLDGLYEQAVPSYLHSNRLMAWLFWQRLGIVMSYMDTQTSGRVLDYGCGTGVLFPYLLGRSEILYAYDLDFRSSRYLVNRLGLNGVNLLDSDDGMEILESGTLDTIIALDVLEHVDDLSDLLGVFKQLLRPTGQIIVSGPTETFFYRLGRKLAGFESHSHMRNIFDIEEQMRPIFDLQLIARLYPPITLFRVSVAKCK